MTSQPESPVVNHQSQLAPADNKFHLGNGENGKHYWITPPDPQARVRGATLRRSFFEVRDD